MTDVTDLVPATTLIIHIGHDPIENLNDIALLRLARPVNFGRKYLLDYLNTDFHHNQLFCSVRPPGSPAKLASGLYPVHQPAGNDFRLGCPLAKRSRDLPPERSAAR